MWGQPSSSNVDQGPHMDTGDCHPDGPLAMHHGPMGRPPPIAHTNNHGGPIFSPPQTPTPSHRQGPLGQDGLNNIGPMGPMHQSNHTPGLPGSHTPGLPTSHTPGLPIGIAGMASSTSSHTSTTSPSLVVPQPVKGSSGGGGGGNPVRSIKTYHCRMCDQIFESKSDLLVHSQHVHKQDPKPYKCPTCNKCFANSSYLSQHARIHSGIKPYKCQICERRFTQLCHLQQHIRTHTGEKPYKCQHPGCGKAFSQLSNLQSHSRSHMTDKPYRCNSCYKCFTDEQSLREHIPKHSETKHLKTHICRICGKSYTQETYLARHMTKHNVDGQSRMAFPGKPINSNALGPPPGLHDLHDIKMEGSGALSPAGHLVDPSKSSAFMPLAHHQFSPSPNLMNSAVPSSLPFAPRVPNNSLNSPLSHLASGSMPSRYFPFADPFTPKTRDPMMERGMSMSREGMIANSLLSLQQIKNFSSSHPVFPKSEPSSPSHKEFQHKEYP